jgi:transposase
MPRITVDEWVAELKRLNAPPEGLTLREWQDRLGVGYHTVRRVLIGAREQGVLQCTGYRVGTSIDGKAHRLPVYALLEGKTLSGVAFNQVG